MILLGLLKRFGASSLSIISVGSGSFSFSFDTKVLDFSFMVKTIVKQKKQKKTRKSELGTGVFQ
jgi:hypothetical protein